MQWSKYQTDIFAAVDESHQDLVIQACAGSGKTTVAREVMRRSKGKNLYTAFNVDIVKDPDARMPEHVDCRGLNSLGMQTIFRNRQVVLQSKKLEGLFNRAFRMDLTMSRDKAAVLKLVRFAKANLLMPSTDASKWQALIDRQGLAANELDDGTLIAAARVVLDLNNKMTGQIDFDDQIYFPAVFGWAPTRYDTVLVDEFQDMTLAQIALVIAAARDGGRIIVLGDRNQSIYQWRNALPEAIDAFKQERQALELPLSISYRCAKHVVAHAQSLVPQIEAADDAPDGVVEYLPGCDASTFHAGDLIVSRRNAPLVSMAYKLLADRFPIHFTRTDIGAAIMKTIRNLDSETRGAMIDELTEWEVSESNRLRRADKDAAAEQIEQRAETARVVLRHCKASQREPILAEIKAVFDRPKREDAVILSSVHRAKGAEADRVFILNEKDMEPDWVKDPARRQEERNIHYVAITRAKTALAYVDEASYAAVPSKQYGVLS